MPSASVLRPRPLFACAAVGLALSAPRAARAEDTVRECIAASTEGQTLRDHGALLQSRDRFVACARDACPTIVRSHCARWLADVDRRIPSLVVRAQDASGADRVDATLSIDDKPAKLDGHPVPLDPGTHVVTVTASGAPAKSQKVLLAEGETSRVLVVRVEPTAPAAAPPPPAPPPDESFAEGHHVPLGAWILGGGGVLALGGGLAFTLLASSDLSTLQSSCSPHCLDSQTTTGRTHALLGDVFFAAGGAAVAGAVVWAVVWPASDGASAGSGLRLDVRPTYGGGAAVLTARY